MAIQTSMTQTPPNYLMCCWNIYIYIYIYVNESRRVKTSVTLSGYEPTQSLRITPMIQTLKKGSPVCRGHLLLLYRLRSEVLHGKGIQAPALSFCARCLDSYRCYIPPSYDTLFCWITDWLKPIVIRRSPAACRAPAPGFVQSCVR